MNTKIIGAKGYDDETYFKLEPYRPIESRDNHNLSQQLIRRFRSLKDEYKLEESFSTINNVIAYIEGVENTTDVFKVVSDYEKILSQINEFLGFIDTDRTGYSNLMTKGNRLLLVTDLKSTNERLEYNLLDHDKFINLTSLMDTRIRHENRKPSLEEYFARQLAFEMIARRGYGEAPIVPWGNSGFRAIQTQASITDPGLGHLTGTVKSLDYINGTNVHIEYLERGEETDRELVEPYRLPDLATIAKVKMEVGKDTSVSSYVGRPMFEDTFEHSFVKTVHNTVGVCSAIFMNGLSECKIAIERMTTTQAIKYMKAVSANVVRDPYLQVLAAAFCINYPITDDRPEVMEKNHGKPVVVKDRMAIARLGIELAKAGNFEKVTSDGTANWYPSDPIMEQLGYKNALTLVHEAHENGLLTYFSAGFRFKHLPDIVSTATDGIGLGGAQILRYMDSSNGYHGPFKAQNIKKILDINQKAAVSTLGQGGIVLSRLDRMKYEGSITESEDTKREALYLAMMNKNEKVVKNLLEKLRDVILLPIDLMHPLASWAQRLIDRPESIVFSKLNDQQREEIVSELEKHLEHHDYEEISDTIEELHALIK